MDKALPPTSTLRSHFLLLGQQPAEDNFPPNIFFHSVAAIRNVENARVTVVPKVTFFGSQGLQTVTLPRRALNPHESTVIDFNDEQKAGRLPQDFTQGSLELTPDLDRPSHCGGIV